MVAEERISTQFCGLVLAQDEEEGSYLSSQLVDEVRHMQFYKRFQDEVIRARLLTLLPAVAEAVSPPSEGAFDALGVDDGALAAFGMDTLTRRLAIIGVPLDAGG